MQDRPDADPDVGSLANERTMLAWTRTALAMMAAGGAALRLPTRLEAAGPVLGGAMIGLGAIWWIAGYARYRAGVSAHGAPASILTIRLTWIAACGVALTALVLAVSAT